MDKQKIVVERLTNYLSSEGLEGSFVPMIDTIALKYHEEMFIDETAISFERSVYVNEQGDVRVMAYCFLQLDEEQQEITEKFARAMNEASEAYTYDFDDDAVYIITDINFDDIEDFGDEFEELVFSITKEEMNNFIKALELLINEEISLEEAVEHGLNGIEEEEFDPAQFMHDFEHGVLIDGFFDDPWSFINMCLDKTEPLEDVNDEEKEMLDELPEGLLDNFVFGLFCLSTMKDGVDHSYTVEEFKLESMKLRDDCMLLRINLPEPISERLCYRMDIVYEPGQEDMAKLFVVEKGENNTTFLCSWTQEYGERTHRNYGLMTKDKMEYKDTIAKFYKAEKCSI